MASERNNNFSSGSSLHSAVMKNNFRLAEVLIMRGADVNGMGPYSLWERSDINCSPLHIAVALKNKEIIQLLLKYNADVNIRTSSGETAFYIAATAAIDDNDEIIGMLIDAGAVWNFSSNSSLISTSIVNAKSAIGNVLSRFNLNNNAKSIERLCYLFMNITITFTHL